MESHKIHVPYISYYFWIIIPNMMGNIKAMFQYFRLLEPVMHPHKPSPTSAVEWLFSEKVGGSNNVSINLLVRFT